MEIQKKTAPDVPTAIGMEQPLQKDCTNIISDNIEESNSNNTFYTDFFRQMTDPYYLHSVTLSQLFDTKYDSKPPIIEGLLGKGLYIFAGAPKVGKSFLMSQFAHHISIGEPLWGYPVRKSAVLYLALEDDYARIQKRMYRMFGCDKNDDLILATKIDCIGGNYDQQLSSFLQTHPNVNVVIVDTLQKIRGTVNDCNYSSDYQVMSMLKGIADNHGICLLLVHHTRKQKSEDTYDTISGTNGLFGAADGAFVMYKEKRTSNTAILEVTGRDLQDQKLTLVKNPDTLIWELESKETELWKEPLEPLLEDIAKFINTDNPKWSGTATELTALLGIDINPNVLTRKLNVMSDQLLNEYNIAYDTAKGHNGRSVTLMLQV